MILISLQGNPWFKVEFSENFHGLEEKDFKILQEVGYVFGGKKLRR